MNLMVCRAGGFVTHSNGTRVTGSLRTFLLDSLQLEL
jgi:hypothetical protein